MNTQLSSPALAHLSPASDQPRERQMLEQLVERLRAGDAVWVGRVLRELAPEVRRWMFRLLGPGHGEYEDAVQDALTEIASALHRFEGRSSLSTLAHRITTRTAYRYYGRPRVAAIDVDEVEGAHDVERRTDARRSLARLFALLDRLHPTRRTVFVLCAMEGLTPQEAAEVTNSSANAVRTRLCRARAQIEEWMRDAGEGGGS